MADDNKANIHDRWAVSDNVLEELKVHPRFTPAHEIWLEYEKLKGTLAK
jgi:hypothetical protein